MKLFRMAPGVVGVFEQDEAEIVEREIVRAPAARPCFRRRRRQQRQPGQEQ